MTIQQSVRATPYVMGATGGVSGAAKVDVPSGTFTDLGLSCSFTLANQCEVAVDVAGWIVFLSDANGNTYSTARALTPTSLLDMYSTLGSTSPEAFLFNLYDGAVDLGIIGSFRLTNDAGTEAYKPAGRQIKFKKSYFLSTGAHNLKLYVTPEGISVKGSTSNIFVYIDPTLTVKYGG